MLLERTSYEFAQASGFSAPIGEVHHQLLQNQDRGWWEPMLGYTGLPQPQHGWSRGIL